MDLVKCGAFLKTLRKEKGYTQAQIAEKMNVTNRTVSRWETGTNLPDIDIIIALSEIYDVSIDEVLDGRRHDHAIREKHVEELSGSDLIYEKTIIKAAEFGTLREKHMARNVFIAAIACVITVAILGYVYTTLFRDIHNSNILHYACVFLFVSYCICMPITKSSRTTYGYFVTLFSGLIAFLLSIGGILFLFFGLGFFHNYGIAGLYIGLGINLASYLICGTASRLLITKRAGKANKEGVSSENK